MNKPLRASAVAASRVDSSSLVVRQLVEIFAKGLKSSERVPQGFNLSRDDGQLLFFVFLMRARVVVHVIGGGGC